MNYKVNPDSLSAVFMVPSQIVDKHIKLAGGQQLKVLLWTLRHAGEGFDMEKLCRDLNFSVPDAQDYLQYWVETGILVSDGTADSAFAPVVSEKNAEPPKAKKELPDIEPSRPTAAEIAQRAEESADFFFVKHFFLKKRQNSPFSSREIPCFRWVIFIYTSLRMRACSIR